MITIKLFNIKKKRLCGSIADDVGNFKYKFLFIYIETISY